MVVGVDQQDQVAGPGGQARIVAVAEHRRDVGEPRPPEPRPEREEHPRIGVHRVDAPGRSHRPCDPPREVPRARADVRHRGARPEPQRRDEARRPLPPGPRRRLETAKHPRELLGLPVVPRDGGGRGPPAAPRGAARAPHAATGTSTPPGAGGEGTTTLAAHTYAANTTGRRNRRSAPKKNAPTTVRASSPQSSPSSGATRARSRQATGARPATTVAPAIRMPNTGPSRVRPPAPGTRGKNGPQTSFRSSSTCSTRVTGRSRQHWSPRR